MVDVYKRQTKAYVDFQSLVRGVITSIGYDNALYGFDSNTCAVISTCLLYTSRCV